MSTLKSWVIISRTRDGDMFAADTLYTTETNAKRHEHGMVNDPTVWRKVQRIDIDLFNEFRSDPVSWGRIVYIILVFDTRFLLPSKDCVPFYCRQEAYPTKEAAVAYIKESGSLLETKGFTRVYDRYTSEDNKVKYRNQNDKDCVWEAFIEPVMIPLTNGIEWKRK